MTEEDLQKLEKVRVELEVIMRRQRDRDAVSYVAAYTAEKLLTEVLEREG